MGLKEQGVAMATAWHALSPGKRKCHSLRGLNRKRARKTEAREGIQVCASECSDRLDALLLIFVATAVTLSVEFLYNQINHLPSPSSLPTQPLTSFAARTDDNEDVDLIERRSLSKKLKSKSSHTRAQSSSLPGI